ncbi:MAG: BamA/TamA family outer membrane protein [Deltaproteobacteria bacterium]|nr:BamA/TamA family outer membrane protein [Deltaproteobacteria bacterium]
MIPFAFTLLVDGEDGGAPPVQPEPAPLVAPAEAPAESERPHEPAEARAAAPAAAATAPREPPPPPDFMRNKRRMTDADLEDKQERGYFTGLPLLNSDPDTGVGFGARVYYFHNGLREDPIFAYSPYRHRAYGQVYATTNGFQYHTLDYDAPYLGGLPIRLKATLAFERNNAAHYYGQGERSLARLRFPGSPSKYASASDYDDALRRIQPDGTAFTRYDHYILTRPQAAVSLERDFFGGVVRGLVGVSVSYAQIQSWTGRTVDATGDTEAVQAPTRLDRDCAAGLLVGCAGGWNNTLKLGVVYDTRDFEPDPNSGMMLELTGELSGKYTASDYDYARLTFAPRFFYSPFPKLADLVFAGRLVTSVQTTGVPFFAANQLSMTDVNRFGLGGLRTIRGFAQDRFVGRFATLLNLEVRWTFVEFNLTRKQHFGLMLVPFFDVGRVFDSISDFKLERFRNGQGAGLRIAWNQATIVVIDYGVSREDSSLYINFNHPF